MHYQTMRPAAFLFLFGVDICISFLPLYMERLYVPLPGLSKDIVIGIPISVRMLFTGILDPRRPGPGVTAEGGMSHS